MEEIVKNEEAMEQPQERVYTQTEVSGIINQYKIAIEQLKNAAQEEINKRDLSNFYQTLGVLFEVVKERQAYSAPFVEKVISIIEGNISSSISEHKKEEENKDEQQVR